MLFTKMREEAQAAAAMFEQIRELAAKDDRTQEDEKKLSDLIEGAKGHKAKAEQFAEIVKGSAAAEKLLEMANEGPRAMGSPGYKSLGEWITSVAQAGDIRYRGPLDPRLTDFVDTDEPAAKADWLTPGRGQVKTDWEERESKASLVSNVGARGGYLVPQEFRAELLGLAAEQGIVRSRATIIPMRRRQVQIPVVDQTGTTAGQPHWFGGLVASWTEEASQKTETDPTFRSMVLTAHKLVLYTRSSDELLDDEAVGLAQWLTGPMGFRGAIQWEEDYTFLRGTGVGQPLGVLNAGATVSVARQADSGYSLADFANMLEAFIMTGGQGVWMISQSAMSNIITMSGPSGNASYIWQPSAREGIPATILGMPVIWTEKLPAAGSAGDILLCNWPYYLIGDREGTTIESTNQERFQYDQTSWRAVHRVDGQPWLSTPATLADGSTQMSPFVKLIAKSS